MEDGEVNNTPEHIAEYIEGTIKRLGSTPDLYYLHRIDPKQDLEASITALDKLKKEGKTKYIGLSECNAQTLRKACSCKSHSHPYQTEQGEFQLTIQMHTSMRSRSSIHLGSSTMNRMVLSTQQENSE